jgi:hypothetical protein
MTLGFSQLPRTNGFSAYAIIRSEFGTSAVYSFLQTVFIERAPELCGADHSLLECAPPIKLTSSGQNRVSMIHPALGRQRTKSTRLREPTPPADRELVTKTTVVECLFARPKINQPF